jgi:Flp pilus assembly protein TadG
MRKKIAEFVAETSGGVATFAALGLVVFCGFAALTVDLGHFSSVKNDLQRAADAGALAGARALCTTIPASASLVDKPNFTNGTSVATATVQENKSDGTLLTDADVQVGYWDTKWTWSTAPRDSTTGAITLLPTSTPVDPADSTDTRVPAVRVKVDKKAGANGGKVSFFLAGVLGIVDGSASAQGVGAVFPRRNKGIYSVPAQSCIPFATPITWVQQHWNDDPPTPFRIGSSYHADEGGQWTSFLLDANNVPTIRNLIDNGNPTPLKVGDQIWIEPGTKDTLFSYVADNLVGKTALLPVVADDYATHDDTPLLAFVAFKVTAAAGGSDKYVEGHFVRNYVDYDATSGGTDNFGAWGASQALVR